MGEGRLMGRAVASRDTLGPTLRGYRLWDLRARPPAFGHHADVPAALDLHRPENVLLHASGSAPFPRLSERTLSAGRGGHCRRLAGAPRCHSDLSRARDAAARAALGD